MRAADRSSMRIIMFISLRMSGAEFRYATTEQEAPAVPLCLQEVQWLVHGSYYPVLVYTDHSGLLYQLKHNHAHGRVARWQMKLCEYDIEYIQIPGTQNVIADGLSRILVRYFTDRIVFTGNREAERGFFGQEQGMRRGDDQRERIEEKVPAREDKGKG